VKLNTNESPLPLPREVLEEALRELAEVPLHRYPDPDARSLRSALARFHAWEPEGVWVANGSNECLHHLLLAYGGPGRTVLTFFPGYSMYPRLVRAVGGRLVEWPLGEGFLLHPELARRAAREVRPDLVLLSSPNNPTGNSQPREAVEALLAGGAGMVVLDQAYVEFGGEDHSELARGDPRVVVVRTFSKAWRLAGARVGYLLASPEVTRVLERVRLPYHLSVLSQVVAEAVLARAELVLAAVEEVRRERERLRSALELLGVRVHPSDANFLLVETALPGQEVVRGLEARGILVRDVSGLPRLERSFRVTVGTREEGDVFLRGLRQVLEEGLARGSGAGG
jgi:histidinol-phosphate aminotransferase